jgi:flagellar biosynthetic protein FliR
MEELLSLLNEQTVYQFLLLLARILAFVVFMPVFGHTAINVTVRIAFAFYLSIFIYPFVDIVTSINQNNFIISLISEITLGLVAAMLVNIIFSAVRIIGEFVEYSTALSMAMMFDPTTNSQEGLVAKLLFWKNLYNKKVALVEQPFTFLSFQKFVYSTCRPSYNGFVAFYNDGSL